MVLKALNYVFAFVFFFKMIYEEYESFGWLLHKLIVWWRVGNQMHAFPDPP